MDEFLEICEDHPPDALLLEACKDGTESLAALERLSKTCPTLPVVLVVRSEQESLALQALHQGATGVLRDPLEREPLKAVLGRILERRRLEVERDLLQADRFRHIPGSLTGHDSKTRDLAREIERLAQAPPVPIMITGQRGAGKELVADRLHSQSDRRSQSFLVLRVGEHAPRQLPAILFGREAQDIRTQDRGKAGLLSLTAGGTLFISEVGLLNEETQALLLEALTEQVFRRLGGDKALPLETRIIVSTSENLAMKTRQEGFREDLFHRLNVLTVHVPSLKERAEDLPALAEESLERAARELCLPYRGLTKAAIESLTQHSWTGNFHELESCLRCALILSNGNPVGAHHLWPGEPNTEAVAPGLSASQSEEGDWVLRDMEERLIRRALDRFQGNRARAARELGINRSTLYNKLRAYGIA